jgi:hypothetical protein
MKDISTYILMLELRNRIDDILNDPEPMSDPVLETLLQQSDVMVDTLESMKGSLNNVMNRYYQIMQRSDT